MRVPIPAVAFYAPRDTPQGVFVYLKCCFGGTGLPEPGEPAAGHGGTGRPGHTNRFLKQKVRTPKASLVGEYCEICRFKELLHFSRQVFSFFDQAWLLSPWDPSAPAASQRVAQMPPRCSTARIAQPRCQPREVSHGISVKRSQSKDFRQGI